MLWFSCKMRSCFSVFSACHEKKGRGGWGGGGNGVSLYVQGLKYRSRVKISFSTEDSQRR